MKKLFILLAIAAIVLSCKNTDEPTVKKPFVIDPMATVNIKPAAGTVLKVKGEDNPNHLTALEIVKQSETMRYVMRDGSKAAGGFAPEQRDTISATPMLKMWATGVMGYHQLWNGTYTDSLVLVLDFIEAKNLVLTNNAGDTLAYVPNTTLRTAETKIKTLFKSKDYEPIYKIFNDAYTFIPITGAEYRALNQE